MSHRRLATLLGVVAVMLVFSTGARAAEKGGEDALAVAFFEKNIRPVLMAQCHKCHGGKKTESDFRVDSLEAMTRGGHSGPAIVPHKPDQSLLIQVIRYQHDDMEMPPKGKMDQRIIDGFVKWVRDGAIWPKPRKAEQVTADPEARLRQMRQWWSLQPIADPEPPKGKDSKPAPTAIDRFIQSKLEGEGISPLPPADKVTLLRRASFDLIGLPPTVAEVDAFLKDDKPGAFERVIERLLASNEYGRRWGRHWLDVARYADTSGDGTDMPIPSAWRYRNYVIDAFNRDMPYDQFVIEQLAGDILAKQNPEDRYGEKVIATGFVALSRRFGNSKFADMHLVVDETLDAVGKSMMGLTISCARCHDHKFDPVTIEEYYGLAGYFTSTQFPHAGSEHGREASDMPALTFEGQRFAQYTAREAELTYRITRLSKSIKKYNRDADKKELAAKKAELSELKKQEKPKPAPLVWGVSDKTIDAVGDTEMMMRGDPHRLGRKVPRSFIAAVADGKPAIGEGQSGRLALARWIASPGNPLTARVMVNRIWLHHFGKPLVATPNNFGHQGKKPSHPALLDYLASRFMEQGWSIKAMHRLIMKSAAYQRSSRTPDGFAALSKDADNRLYWRFDRRRLDAEAIRDGIKFVSGTLDLSTGTNHPFPDLRRNRFTQHRPFQGVFKSDRRTVFLMNQRLHKHPYLALFDGPNTNTSTAIRRRSTVPLQALFLKNSDFMERESEAFAKRLHGQDPAITSEVDRVILAHRQAWGVTPDSQRVAAAVAYLDRYAKAARDAGQARSEADARQRAWVSYARVLLSSNAFLYVD